MYGAIASLVIAGWIGVVLVGCLSPASTLVRVSKVMLDKSNLDLLAGGAPATLTAIVLPENASQPGVNWTSSSDSVVQASPTGVVTPVTAGTAIITAASSDGSQIASCRVTVALMAMVQVPGGTFLRDGVATNTSSVSAYHLGRNLVTRTQFLAVMGTDPSNTAKSNGTSDPVQMVNWYQAISFCNKLSLVEGLVPVYSLDTITDWSKVSFKDIPTSANDAWDSVHATWTNNGYRLPTEMEYLWAAMGATSDGRVGDLVAGVNTGGYTKGYAGSMESGGSVSDVGNSAWIDTNSGGLSHPVGTKKANELGLFDMSGNVSELIWDWEGTVPQGALTDYRGPFGLFRVLHGGSYAFPSSFCALGYRSHTESSYRGSATGFRIARL